ncbi:MAG: hypothetical protein DME12_21375 [Candidatus Rokuibacteriota bacterium]|nr:MAG: hypothetical protein DME12_21375 [Candidatus Rokubacteria bacterium]
MNRRILVAGTALLALVVMLTGLPGGLRAQGKVVKIGLSLPLTGADADGADAILKGAQMAVTEINAKGGVAGYKLEAVVFDSATPAAGQYDPAQAATNYKKFIADSLVMAAVGPVMSGEGKAISPILSEADMATITPSSTNPDITDPKFQPQYRPKGKAVYFRTVTTDAYQGPNMANYLFHAQKIKSVFRLPGPEHGELSLPRAEDQERLRTGRRRRLRRRHRGQLPEAGGRVGREDPRA